MTHHPPSSEIRALLVLLAVFQKAVQRPDSVGHQVMWFEAVEILTFTCQHSRSTGAGEGGFTDIMIDARVDLFALLLFLLDEPCCQTAAASIDYAPTLFTLD